MPYIPAATLKELDLLGRSVEKSERNYFHCLDFSMQVKTEDRNLRRYLFEFRERRVPIHGHVRSRSRRSPQVGFDNRRTLLDGDFFQLKILTTQLRRIALPPAARTF